METSRLLHESFLRKGFRDFVFEPVRYVKWSQPLFRASCYVRLIQYHPLVFPRHPNPLPSPRACVSFCHTHCALYSHVENGPFMGQICAPFSLRSGPPSLYMCITSSTLGLLFCLGVGGDLFLRNFGQCGHISPAEMDHSTVFALCCVHAPFCPCARRSDAADSCVVHSNPSCAEQLTVTQLV
jgi:hypothetical protein